MLLVVFSIFISSSGSACFDMRKNNSPARPVSPSASTPVAHFSPIALGSRGGGKLRQGVRVCMLSYVVMLSAAERQDENEN